MDSWPACHEFELVPLKISRAEGPKNVKYVEAQASSHWCGVEVKRGGARVILVTGLRFKITRSVTKSPRVSEQCDVNIHSLTIFENIRVLGCGSPVVKVSDHGRHVMSSSQVSLKTRCVGQRCTLNLSRAETSSRWYDVVVRRVVPAQVSSTLLDYGSKLRGPSPKALV
ncbi:uncharacterized protein TNCV_1533141 [Trichonephila clavipes]|nr:uncharacterized protein TNCV_1533141 [Trichonephila clavipes]